MKKILVSALSFALPAVAFAQVNAGPIVDANTLAARLIALGNLFTYILITIAVLYIIWHIVIYLIKGGSDEETRKKAGSSILWGIIGLFLILSVWGLVNILANTFKTASPYVNAGPNPLGNAPYVNQ
ncbi:MAG: hypothetical protein KGJ33_03060 [Patescibacteria group bacterium]|nr:hypothetical protein [Patescibacteria group bacterium]